MLHVDQLKIKLGLALAATLISSTLAGTAQAANLQLTWVNNSAVATNVRIERCLGAGCTNFSEIGVVAGTVGTFLDTTLGEAQSATYRIRASQGSPATVFSSYSNVAGNVTGLNDPTGLIVIKP